MPEQPMLSDMIKKEVDKGVTYAELEKRAADPTTGTTRISDSQINRYALGTATRMPTEEQARGLATALRLPYEHVRQAVIAQWLPAADEEEAERERREQIAELKRLRDQANAALARLEQQDEAGGLPAG
jgi:hypothetical protein